MTPAEYVAAARFPAPPEAPRAFGPWLLERQDNPFHGWPTLDWVGFPHLTVLRRATPATLHQGGEVVMEDSKRELERHLPIWMAAGERGGRVLVTGLGLGCVVRGLLASPRVVHIDVIEVDRWILSAFGPEFEGNPRVTLHADDALTWTWNPDEHWDWAWHDLWCEGDGLQRLHAQLFYRYRGRVRHGQGAWAFPRFFKRLMGPGWLG